MYEIFVSVSLIDNFTSQGGLGLETGDPRIGPIMVKVNKEFSLWLVPNYDST